jgi:tetratricopeptide (TPR) repeat protein
VTKKILLAFCLLSLLLAACSRSEQAQKTRFMQAGRRLYDQKDYARAILEWKNAVQVATGDPEPSYWLGMAYLRAGNIAPAIASFRTAAQIDPKHAAAQLKIGELLATSNDPALLEDSLKRLKIALDGGETSNALNAIALTEIKLGKTQDAEQHLGEALTRFPQELSSYMVLAKTKLLKHDSGGAEEVLKKAIAASPNSADARVGLGSFYGVMQRDHDAEKLFREAVQLDPKNGSALYELAMLTYRTGRKAEAEQLFGRLSTFPDPQLMSMHAVYLVKEGDKAGAVAELEKLVRDNPKVTDFRTKLIAAYWISDRLDAVESMLTAAIKKNPKDLDALLQRGELYVATNRYWQAQTDLDTVRGMRPDSAVVHWVIAKLNQARGADLTYRHELTEAIRFDPAFLQARVELAQRFTATGAAESALKILDEAPSEQKNNLSLLIERNWALLSQKKLDDVRGRIKAELAVARPAELLIQDGWVKIMDKNYSAAQMSIDEAVHNAPEDPRILSALVALYTAQKQTASLEKRLKTLGEASTDARTKYFVGNWLLQNGDRGGAKAFFEAARRTNPDFREAEVALAVVDMNDGKLDDARALLKSVMAVRDQDVELLSEAGALELAAGRVPDAIVQFRKILAIDRNNIHGLNNLAYLLANTNQSDEALALAQQARELAPGTVEVEDTLGWVLYRRGIYGEAVSYLESAAKKSSDPAIQYHVGLAYLKAGKWERGKQVLTSALKAAPQLEEAQMAKRELGIGQ